MPPLRSPPNLTLPPRSTYEHTTTTNTTREEEPNAAKPPPPRRSLTYTLQRPSSALHSPPYPGVNQKLTHPRNPCRLHPLHLRALTFTLHHTPQHQGRAPRA